MKILVTGASGLLGGCVAAELAARHDVTGAVHTGEARGEWQAVRLDVANQDEVARVLDGQGYAQVVHCAAIRSPEECAADVARAYRVNAAAVDVIAEACNRNRCALLYISTDYVFPGDAPPYREHDRDSLRPLNVYGRTKLAGEFAARASARHLVARIPALWGDDPDDPKGTQLPFLDNFRKGKPFPVENRLVRHYTLAGDVAKALAFCVENGIEGTVHLSARESQTKADFARAVARLHGCDAGLVVDTELPADAIRRPADSTLDTSRYESAGGPALRGLSEAMEELRRQKRK